MNRISVIKKIDALFGRAATVALPRQSRSSGSGLSSRRILIIRPGGIGDAILLVPAIAHLTLHYPEAEIDILAEKRNAGAFALCDSIARVYRYDVLSEFWQVFGHRYDVVIDSEQWHRLSAVVARMIRSRIKIGFATNERRRMFTDAVDYSESTYEADSFFQLLEPLGISSFAALDGTFLIVCEADKVVAARLLATVSPSFVVIFPGASIAERRWAPEKFMQVARNLVRQGLTVVVVGGKDDVESGNIIAQDEGLNLCGKTSIAQTAAVLERAALLISGDSGVLHMGVGLNISTVSLFGPGIEKKWGPRGDNHIVISQHLTCSPCTRFGLTPKCPIGGRCIQEITPEDVSRAALSLLKRLPSDALCMRSKV